MSGSSLSTTLLQRVVAREPDAWQRLFQLHGPILYSRCRSRGLQPSDAADVVQEVFLAAVKSIQRFRRDGANASFRAWLWGIARNKLKDHWRAQARDPEGEGGSDAARRLQEMPEEGDDTSETSDEVAETAGLLRRALELIRGEFADRTWKAFWGFEIDGRPAADLAVQLGMTPNAVHIATSRVRKRLREEFADLL
jgi:RNA polymerase sigma-70 factor (ECF subfamily)